MFDLFKFEKLNLFEGLSPAQMEEVLHIVSVRGYQAGDYIFQPGGDSNTLYILHHGTVKTFVLSAGGDEKIMHMFYAGDAFGALLLGTTRGDLPWAQAVSDVVVSIMDEAAFKRFIQLCADACMNLFRYLAEHHAADMRRLESFIHTRADRRLVLTLLEVGERLGHGAAEEFALDPCFTHENLANMVGVVRSTASALISELRRAGVLRGQGRCLIVNRCAAEQYLLSDGALATQLQLHAAPDYS